MTDRYAIEGLFQPVGPEELEKIGSASVVIAGCGALGSAVAAVLARSGVGRLRIIDRDIVRSINLQKQSLFTEQEAESAVPRASAAARAAREINPEIQVEDFVEDITLSNIRDLCGSFDVLVDGLDNFESKFLVNEFSVETGMPWIYVSVSGSSGISRGIVPGETPCLRCLFPEDPAPGNNGTPASGAGTNSVVSAIASFQAAQVLGKVVTGAFSRDVLSFDSWSGTWESWNSEGGPVANCPCCRERDFPYLEGRITGRITRLCGVDSFQVYPAVRDKTLNLHELAGRLGKKNILRCNDYLLQVRIDEYDLTVFSNGRAIFKGVKDIVEARILYSRFIGN